jgi:hypothetical protein
LLGDPSVGFGSDSHVRPRRAHVQNHLQLAHLRIGELALRSARPLWSSAPPARSQDPPTPVPPKPATRGNPRYLLVAGPGLDQLRRLQPYLLPASSFRHVWAAAIALAFSRGVGG